MTTQSYGADRAAAFRVAERGEYIDAELAARAEAAKLGITLPTYSDNASRRELAEARYAATILTNGLLQRAMQSNGNPTPSHNAALQHASTIIADCTRRLSLGDSGVLANVTRGDSAGVQAFRALQENADLLAKTGTVRFTIKGAATDPATTATTRSIVSGGVGYPSGAAVGLQNGFSQRTVDSVSVVEYSRYSSTEGAAAVQAAEGDAKAAVAPRFTLISQKAITVAGYCKVSTQALADQSEVQRAIDVTLRRSITTAIDDVLTAGSGALFGGLESLATAYTSLVYQRHADAVSEGVSTMQQAGFNPDVVAFAPSDWLGVQTLQTATEELCLSGSYLGPQPEALRGLRVVVSPGLTAGASLLLDSSQCELVICDGLTVQIGLNSDDFTRNLRTILAEARIIPTFRAVGAARLITPKA